MVDYFYYQRRTFCDVNLEYMAIKISQSEYIRLGKKYHVPKLCMKNAERIEEDVETGETGLKPLSMWQVQSAFWLLLISAGGAGSAFVFIETVAYFIYPFMLKAYLNYE